MDLLFGILHVATAVFIIGPIAIIPMTGLRALRTGDAARATASAKASSSSPTCPCWWLSPDSV